MQRAARDAAREQRVRRDQHARGGVAGLDAVAAPRHLRAQRACVQRVCVQRACAQRVCAQRVCVQALHSGAAL